MCICMLIGIGLVVSVPFLLVKFIPSDSRSYEEARCQQLNNDTGKIFKCEFSKECISSVFSYPEYRNKRPTGRNINRDILCDGSCDCSQSRCEDENEACPNLGCDGQNKGLPGKYAPKTRGNMYQCQNGRCISSKELCNNWDDCGDNSDESNCWSANDGRCYIPASRRCDGRNDCRGNVDERNC